MKSILGVSSIRLWDFPFHTLSEQLSLEISDRRRDALEFEPFAMRPGLWKGRTRHTSRAGTKDALGDNLDRKPKDNRKISDGYLSKSVRPTSKVIAESGSEDKRVDTTSKLGECLLGRPHVVRRRQALRRPKWAEPARAHRCRLAVEIRGRVQSGWSSKRKANLMMRPPFSNATPHRNSTATKFAQFCGPDQIRPNCPNKAVLSLVLWRQSQKTSDTGV